MSAKETLLGLLHEKLTEEYINQLTQNEAISPALLTSISKFLKDNGIQAEVGDESMDKIKERTANLLQFPFDPRKEAQG